LAAKQFSIKLGVYTLPEMFSEKENEKYIFSEAFLEKISRHFVLVKHEKDSSFELFYATDTKLYFEGKVS
jgi:hypothetical protein